MERVTVWDCSCTSSSACLTVTGLHVLPDSNGCLFGSEECSLTEGVCWGNPNLTQPPEQSVCFFFHFYSFLFFDAWICAGLSCRPAQLHEHRGRVWASEANGRHRLHHAASVHLHHQEGVSSFLSTSVLCHMLECVVQEVLKFKKKKKQSVEKVSLALQANINGRVLTQCSLDELKKEMQMNFGDWQLFRGMVRLSTSVIAWTWM